MITAKPLINSKFASTSSTLEYTVPAATKTIIDKFTATNTDAGSVTISVHLVPSGGAINDSCLLLKAISIAAGATFDSQEMKNQILNTGDAISVIVSTASKVVIRASGREVT